MRAVKATREALAASAFGEDRVSDAIGLSQFFDYAGARAWPEPGRSAKVSGWKGLGVRCPLLSSKASLACVCPKPPLPNPTAQRLKV